MEKTFLEIKEAKQLVEGLCVRDPNLTKGKFAYAWKRFIDKNYDPTNKELNEELDDNKIEYCLTDPVTKEILYNERGGYRFDKEGTKAVVKAGRDLIKEYDAKKIEVIPFVVKPEDVPELDEVEKEVLTGLII